MTTTPEDSRYAKTHEYVHVEGDVATAGVEMLRERTTGADGGRG